MTTKITNWHFHKYSMEKFICKCGKEFSSKLSLYGHQGSCNSYKEYKLSLKNEELKNYEKYEFVCECGKRFKTLKSLGSHGCHCDKYIPRIKKESIYLNNGIYKCECGMEFTNSQSLNAHFSHCDIHHKICGTERKLRPQEIEHKMSGWDNKTSEEINSYYNKSRESIQKKIETDLSFNEKYHTGHPHSEESKKKIGEARRKAIKEGRGNKWIPPHISPSYPEQYFIDLFECNNIEFKNNFSVYPFFLDFAFEKQKLYIEIDGEQHYTEKGIKKDEERTKYLYDKGWVLLKRIRWSEFKKLSKSDKEQIINDILYILTAQVAK